MTTPAPADPEVAAATFAAHLDRFFRCGRGATAGWERIDLDALIAVIRLPAVRGDGTRDHYFVRLGAEYYDLWPPRVAFVHLVRQEEGTELWVDASPGSRWWPNQQNSPGFSFRLHEAYQYGDGHVGQLLCFSHTLEYYLSGHNPSDTERWRQGVHTVSATLTRLADVLTAPNYVGPSGDPDT